MRLFAISDLHLGSPANREALAVLGEYPNDWLIVAGDVAESFRRVEEGFAALSRRFAKVVWTPGNHELWSLPGLDDGLRGVARYAALVDLARGYGILTPEDPWPVFAGDGGPVRIVAIFTLYDYSFGPAGMTPAEMVGWAAEANVHPRDERVLHPDPYPSRAAWCRARVVATEQRLARLDDGLPTVLVGHWPLIEELIRIPRVPRFIPWCGTRATASWPARYGATVCIYGHLHTRGGQTAGGIRFEEVSLGYPRQWRQELGFAAYLTQILTLTATSDI